MEELQWRTESDGREIGGPQTKFVNGRQIPCDATNTSKFYRRDEENLFENLVDCSKVSYSSQVSSERWRWRWRWLF